MARTAHPDRTKVKLTFVAEGTPIALQSAEGGGFVRKAAPSDGLYVEPQGGDMAFFISETDIIAALTPP